MNVYEVMKKGIQRKRYSKDKAKEMVNALYLTEQLTTEQFKELMDLIDTTYQSE